jgi:hypothetical protein
VSLVTQVIAAHGLWATGGRGCRGEKLFGFLRFYISRCADDLCGQNGSGGEERLWYTRGLAKHAAAIHRNSTGWLDVGRSQSIVAGLQIVRVSGSRRSALIDLRLGQFDLVESAAVIFGKSVQCKVAEVVAVGAAGRSVLGGILRRARGGRIRRFRFRSASKICWPNRIEVNVSLNIRGRLVECICSKSLLGNDLRQRLARLVAGSR